MAQPFLRRIIYGFDKLLEWVNGLITKHNDSTAAHSNGFNHHLMIITPNQSSTWVDNTTDEPKLIFVQPLYSDLNSVKNAPLLNNSSTIHELEFGGITLRSGTGTQLAVQDWNFRYDDNASAANFAKGGTIHHNFMLLPGRTTPSLVYHVVINAFDESNNSSFHGSFNLNTQTLRVTGYATNDDSLYKEPTLVLQNTAYNYSSAANVSTVNNRLGRISFQDSTNVEAVGIGFDKTSTANTLNFYIRSNATSKTDHTVLSLIVDNNTEHIRASSNYTPTDNYDLATKKYVDDAKTLNTANRVVVTDANKKLTTSSINTTKLGYLSNVTSDIQTQLNSKSSSDALTGFVKFPNYYAAGGISEQGSSNVPSASSPQTASSNGFLIVTLWCNSSGGVQKSFKLNINGHEILAGRVQSTGHWYNSGCGATVLPLKAGTRWYVPADQRIGTFYWQFIPMES